jgi:hypothetical protein
LDDRAGRYALADGATEGCFTGLWARLLVEDFVHGSDCPAGRWPTSLLAAQQRWDAEVRGRRLPWYAEAGVAQGAFATFLGLVLTPPAGMVYRWQAAAVGDTCLMHTRGAAVLAAFPLDRAGQFDNVPSLVGSRASLEGVRRRRRVWDEGCGQRGDRLWAMTDALAHCCLSEHEAGGNPWGALEALLAAPPEGNLFAAWIEGLRTAGRLRNDDVTLLAIPLEEAGP